MVQCIELTRDCKSCLAWSITKLFKNNDIKQGGRVLGTNCNVRYELYPFLRS
ncbi:BnaC01g14510D [Brassica napus]|uniref:BnaC01g14510D protein n=3 Tax=Brassica TaxID=3705 RepID=A0A078FBW1_BRANA|nr:BnaC01g14510D [Brassica napus]